MIPLVGFLPGDDPRVKSTVDVINRELTRDGFVLRYVPGDPAVDGIGEPEGVFLPCSFWMVEALELAGRGDEARALFDRLLALANDLGLFAEEYDPDREAVPRQLPAGVHASGAGRSRAHARARTLADAEPPPRLE